MDIFEQYRQKYAVADTWQLISNNVENISQVVVIPAYAERDMLFSTLASLAQNPQSSLDYSLILCVINNKKNSPPAIKINNQQVLGYLRALVGRKGLNNLNADAATNKLLELIADAPLKLGYIDAASAGYEIPDNEGGVGMSRKIGMDKALFLLQANSFTNKPILSMDADTLVQSNYLAAVNDYFTGKVKSAVVAYEHQEPLATEEKAAIYCYEIFLRYWILGLRYSKSPYAFHSIGSTMVCSGDAYLAVRGMNRREAGEDFYFLNKLAKIGNVGYVRKTCVYPSARPSLRVPFGTGKRIQRFLDGNHEEYVLYDPLVFEILAQWLLLMEGSFRSDEQEILTHAEKISPILATFLTDCNFTDVWPKMRRNFKNEDNLKKQFHCWFDGFRTLKLINYLTKSLYPPINMFVALNKILKMLQISVAENILLTADTELAEQKKIIQYLRKIT
jgi:hypothetical protein